MTYTTRYADFLCLLATIGLFSLFFYKAWQDFVVDSARQRLFEIRDALFDKAAVGGGLNSQAYKVAREVVNAQIRYAHEMDIVHVLLTSIGAVSSGRVSLNVAGGLVDKIVSDEVDEMLKSEIRLALNQAFIVSATTILRRSMLCIIAIPFALALGLVAASTIDTAALVLRTFGAPIRALAYSDAIGHMAPSKSLRM